MSIESTIRNMLFFPTVKNGFFDYSTPLKQSIKNFTENTSSTEISASLFEYLLYNIIKNKINEGYVNDEIVFISEKFLSSINCKKIFIKANAIHKKNILIFIQNKSTQKWNVIIFIDLEYQLKQCMLDKENQSISAKIISSSNLSDDDDYILNSTMDKLENTFDFKSPEDIQFEVDSINIGDQPNTGIFLLNFIEGLVVENSDNISKSIQKLYDEGSKMDASSKDYLNSFNKMNDVFNDLQQKYQIEIKNDKKEKPKNESKENGLENIDNFVNLNINKETNEIKDEVDLIQIEQDDDIEDDIDSDEEEALRIMEQENEEAKNQMKEHEKKLRQKLNKQKMRLKNLHICRDFGVIQEEENESSSEMSFDMSNKNDKEKSVKEEIEFLKKSITNLRKLTDDLDKKNLTENEKNVENNNNKEIKNNNEKSIINEKKCINGNNIEEDKSNPSQRKHNKDNGVIKSNKKQNLVISVLKNFEEAIQELEIESLSLSKTESKSENPKKINNNKISKANSNNKIKANINNKTSSKKQLDNGNPKIINNKSNDQQKERTPCKPSKTGNSSTIENMKTSQKNCPLKKKHNSTKNKILNLYKEKEIVDSPNKKLNILSNDKKTNSQAINKSISFKSADNSNIPNINKKEKLKTNNKTKKNLESAKKRNKSPTIDNSDLNKNSSDNNNDEFNKKSSYSSRDSTNTQKTNKTEELLSSQNSQKENEIKLEYDNSNEIDVDNEQNYSESLNSFRAQKINEIKKQNNQLIFPINNDDNSTGERKESEKGQSKIRKSLIARRQDRHRKIILKMPPSKENNYLLFNESCDIYEGDDNNICGWCIGEESGSGCFIF